VKTKLKGILRQLHLLLGLSSGLIIFIVAITGCIYCFETEIRSAIHRDLLLVEDTGQQQLSADELVARVHDKFKTPVKNVRLSADRSSSAEVILKDKESVFLNPYSGKILGNYNKEKDFLGVNLRLHRSLCLDDTGKIITAVSVVIFLFMVISGIILWWPAGKRMRKQRLRIRAGVPRFRRLFDLHSVLGFYALVILLFTALTGMIWACHWAENLMYRMTGSVKEERKPLKSKSEEGQAVSIERLIAISTTVEKGWDECFIAMPEDPKGTFRLTFRKDKGGLFREQDQIIFDQYTAKPLKAQFYETGPVGDKVKQANYNIHTGKVFGLAGQLLVFFASLIAASLPVTGFLMWRLKRKQSYQLVAEKRK
jgi:uncharacterized iron-regulated membrane protein